MQYFSWLESWWDSSLLSPGTTREFRLPTSCSTCCWMWVQQLKPVILSMLAERPRKSNCFDLQILVVKRTGVGLEDKSAFCHEIFCTYMSSKCLICLRFTCSGLETIFTELAHWKTDLPFIKLITTCVNLAYGNKENLEPLIKEDFSSASPFEAFCYLLPFSLLFTGSR